MFNRYASRPQRSIIYASLAQERAWGCEYPLGDPWGGPAFGEKNKGGVFSQTYWEKGGIVNSVSSLVSNPIGYTNDRLKELDKTVIQPIGNGLEKAGQAIANDPENFALMLAAAATQQWYIVAAMAMVISAGKGNDWDKVLTDGAIAGATSFVAIEGSNMMMETMKVTAQGATSYAIAGVEISKTAATTIANGVSYTASSAISAAATGKNVGEAALMGAITSGVVSAVGSVDILKDFSAAIDSVAAKGVGSAITNAISGAAGTMLSGIVTGKDMSTQAGMALVGGAVSGLTSAIKISGDFFSNNAAEALDLQYDDYGPRNDTQTVAEYLTDKLGVAGAGFVTNTVTSILTSTFTKGDPSTFLAQQVMGGLTQFVKNSFDPRFKSQYVDPFSKYMADAESAAKEFNALANSQNALGAEINGNITTYNNRVAAVNDIINQRAALAAQYNGYTSANSSQAQVDATYNQIKALDARITAEVNSINSFYQTGIIDKQAQYDAANIKTIEAQNNYNSYSGALGDAAVPLTKYLNDVAKDMSIATAKVLDPDFNPEEYRTINGLSSSVDVGAHYISTGKDAGLYTNFAASDAYQKELEFKAMDKFAASMGYSGGAMSLPESVYNDSLDKMRSFYGNNLKAWESFTPASFTEQIKLPPTAIMPMWESESGKITTAQVIYDNGQEQLVNITTQLPTGQSAASGAQILRGEANVIRGDDGKFYWAVPDGKSTVPIYDVSTGRMVEALIGPAFESAPAGATDVKYDGEGRVLGYTSADGVPHVNIHDMYEANPTDTTLKNLADKAGTDINDVDPMMQMYTYSAMPDGIAANFNVKGIVQASKDIVDYMQKDASDINKLKIATVVKSAGSVMQDVGTVLQDLSVTIGLSKTGETGTLQSLGKQLENLASASTPEQYKKAMEDIKAMRDAAKGTDIVGVNAAIAQKYPDLVGVSVFGGELFEEVIQSGIGKAAFVAGGALAATLGAPALVAAGVAAAFGQGTAMALDFAESYRGGKEDMYARMLDVYKGQGYSDAQAAQMADAAASKAGIMNGAITMVLNAATPGDLNKVLFGGKASPAQESIINYFVDKVTTAGKVALVEFGQGGVEGALQGAYNEALVYSVDPKKADYWKGIADSAMLESIIGAPVAAGTYGIDNSFEMAQKTFTLANEQFTSAIESTGIHTVGELGAVMKQWGVPTTVAVDIVPDVIESNPTLLNAYSSPAELTSALTSAFGFDANQAADIANIKFNNQITTADEAKTALLNAGLTGVTDKDIVDSGIVGVTAADQANKVSQYANQQMVTEAEVRAAAAQENYDITAEELSKLVGRGVQADVIAKFISEVDPKAVNTAEATQYFLDQGYTKARAEDIAQFVKSAPEDAMKTAVAEWVNPRQVTRAEALQFFSQIGYTPSEAEIAQFVVQGPEVFQDAIKTQLGEYVDPRFVDAAEVREAFKNMGLNAPITASDVARLSGQYSEAELAGKAEEALPIVSANAVYALMAGEPSVVQSVKDELLAKIEGYKNLGMSGDAANKAAIDAVSAQLGTSSTNLLNAIGATEQNLLVKISNTEETLLAKINEYKAQGLTQQAATQKALDEMSASLGTTKADLLSKIGATEENLYTQISGVRQELLDKITLYQQQGLTQQAATQKALDEMSANLGTTKASLLAQIGATEANLMTKLGEYQAQTAEKFVGIESNIAVTKQSILDQMAAYEKAGMDRDTALDLSISGVSQDLGLAKADLLQRMGTSEEALRAELTGTKEALSGEIQQVADTLGKPVQAVTQADIDYVKNYLTQTAAGTQVTPDMVYDVNQDGKIDVTDQTALEQAVAQQNQPDYIDPDTGLPNYIFNPSVGSKWAPTGLYAEQLKTQTQQAAAAKAAAQTAKQNQQKQNFSQMMQMVLGAEDAGGQKVSVSEAPLAQIKNIYDWSSIFATPQQAALMPSPYGAINVYGQSPQQQGGLGSLGGVAANQPMYKQASGFAEGGMINNDMSVGDGGNIDDLLNILKGNSG